jgi:hypothetical protein
VVSREGTGAGVVAAKGGKEPWCRLVKGGVILGGCAAHAASVEAGGAGVALVGAMSAWTMSRGVASIAAATR